MCHGGDGPAETDDRTHIVVCAGRLPCSYMRPCLNAERGGRTLVAWASVGWNSRDVDARCPCASGAMCLCERCGGMRGVCWCGVRDEAMLVGLVKTFWCDELESVSCHGKVLGNGMRRRGG